jgi:ribose transport system permease protein
MNQSQAASTQASFWNRWIASQDVRQALGMLVVLAILVAIFGMLSDNFLQWGTAKRIAREIPDLAVIAIGMTLVLVVGGIDLSVGSVFALSSAVLAVLMVDHQVPLLPACLAAMVCGGIAGLINGSISVLAGIPSFIVSLGTLEIARGLCYLLTNSQSKHVGLSIESLNTPLLGTSFLTPSIALAIAVIVIAHLGLTRTVFGRYWIAIGTNVETVRMSGIRPAPYTISVFVLCGLLCGLSAIFNTARLNASVPSAGVGLELQAIAACVIGGTSLLGGRGSIICTILGVVLIAVLQSGLAQVGASEPSKRIITGAVIVVAVLLDALRKRLSR